jgi:hypothetical protein
MSDSGDANRLAVTRCVLCPECGYRLDGLPHEGNCPECGSDYSSHLLILYGTGGHGASIGMMGVTPLASLAAFFLLVAIVRNGLTAGLLLMSLALIAAIAWIVWHKWSIRVDAPAEAQLRIAPEGFGMRHGFGELLLTAWDPRYKISIIKLSDGRHRMSINAHAWIRPAQSISFTFEADEATVDHIHRRIALYRRLSAEAARAQ